MALPPGRRAPGGAPQETRGMTSGDLRARRCARARAERDALRRLGNAARFDEPEDLPGKRGRRGTDGTALRAELRHELTPAAAVLLSCGAPGSPVPKEV